MARQHGGRTPIITPLLSSGRLIDSSDAFKAPSTNELRSIDLQATAMTRSVRSASDTADQQRQPQTRGD